MPHNTDPSPYQYPYPPLRQPQQHPQAQQQYQHHPLSNSSPIETPYGYTSYNTAYVPKTGEEARILVRTPSPTPSEQRELQTGALDWKKLSSWRFWIRREWVWYYVALVIILVVSGLIIIYHTQIVNWLKPVTQWLHGFTLGWLVPIAVLFVISFPPLFGHEIVAVLCGLVWGMWIGFAIVAAGTFLGEVGNFYAFKYCCRARGEKMEKNNLTYACLAKVVRDGGFKIALVARLSAIPGHFTTAIFSTCGMGILVFSLAAILSMPKQFITVYLGVILEQSATGDTDTKSRIISDVVLAITILITVLAMWYIYWMMNKVKPQVIYERRKARQAKLARAASGSASDHTTPTHSDDAIPLTLRVQPPSLHRPLSEHTNDPAYLYAPQPRAGRHLPSPHVPEDVEYTAAEGSNSRNSTDDASWEMEMSGAPMQHPGMGREVVGGRGAYGYGYASRYGAGESEEALTGGRASETRTPESRGGEEWEDREFGRGYAHGHGGEGTEGSYRTASEGSEGGSVSYGMPPRQVQVQDSRRPAASPPPSYRADVNVK